MIITREALFHSYVNLLLYSLHSQSDDLYKKIVQMDSIFQGL